MSQNVKITAFKLISFMTTQKIHFLETRIAKHGCHAGIKFYTH